jgi:hypothetical protein
LKIRKALAPVILAGAFLGVAGVTGTPVSAQTAHQGGQPYGCTINPNAPGCNNTPQNSTTPPPAILPSTGGGAQPIAPGSPLDPAALAIAGGSVLLAGFALRRATRRQ